MCFRSSSFSSLFVIFAPAWKIKRNFKQIVFILPIFRGVLAQLEERGAGSAKVRGSIPLHSTKCFWLFAPFARTSKIARAPVFFHQLCSVWLHALHPLFATPAAFGFLRPLPYACKISPSIASFASFVLRAQINRATIATITNDVCFVIVYLALLLYF